MTPFVSNPADCRDVWGFVQISDTVEISRMPIYDWGAQLFARMGWALAAAFLASQDWRLPTVDEYDAMKRNALHVEPYVLPDPGMVLDAGIALHDEGAIQGFREAHMMTREWCTKHDAEVMNRLRAAGWDNLAPVDNAGKHWAALDAAHPARPGHGLIYGWWTPNARRYGVHNDVLIQPPSDFHEAGGPTFETSGYGDYGTTYHAARART